MAIRRSIAVPGPELKEFGVRPNQVQNRSSTPNCSATALNGSEFIVAELLEVPSISAAKIALELRQLEPCLTVIDTFEA
jgi:hypothetical protein